MFGNMAKEGDGGYNSAVMKANGEVVGARDPYGVRSVVYGFSKDKKVFMAASESVALINCGIKDIKPLQPGHMIYVHNGRAEVKK